MNYQEFLTNIKTCLSLQIDSSLTLTIQTFTKNNGTRHDGLIIQNPGLNVSPTIYLKPYYHRYLDGVSIEDICEDILSTYQENLPKKNFDTTIFTDYNRASKRIVMRLINAEKNKALLEEVPHFHYLDLAIVFYCMLCSGEMGQANILIRNDHMKSWGVSADELREVAEDNTRRLLPPDLISMKEILKEHKPDYYGEVEDLDIRMYILTNRYRTNGATVLLYDGLLEKLANLFDKDLILLPSSIHEIIVIPAENGSDREKLEDYSAMVKEVNETELADEEILSEHAYYYIRHCGVVGYRA